MLPELEAALMQEVMWTEAPDQVWFSWRPALYLLLALAGTLVTALRARSARVLLLGAPVAFHSALMMFVTLNQEFRFQYGVYAVALLFGLILLLGRMPPPAPTSSV